jgi:glutamate/tyrosine decarboxylase-like PLP-dependent enzyme
MTGFHMTPKEFRRHGRAVVDWIADYYERVESLPVLSRVEPGEIRASLPSEPPVRGEAFEDILADVERCILPGITHWQSPNFFAFFPANSSGPAVLRELLSAGLGVQGMLWATSPACTELEAHVLEWLVDMMGLPGAFKSDSDGGGVIQDTASGASLTALLAARERASHYGVEGLRHHVRKHVRLAQEFARWVEESERFELAAPAPLNLVCFRYVGGDEINERLLGRLKRSGKVYLTHTKLDEKYTLRLCVGQTYTEERHVSRAWELKTAGQVLE